jgi:hypothetical protein
MMTSGFSIQLNCFSSSGGILIGVSSGGVRVRGYWLIGLPVEHRGDYDQHDCGNEDAEHFGRHVSVGEQSGGVRVDV